MIVVALSVLAVTSVILLSLGLSVRHSQSEILRKNVDDIYSSLENGKEYFPPYGLSFLIYDTKTKQVYSTNDPFLPALPPTDGSVKKYFIPNYFSDGDLNIRYYSQSFEKVFQDFFFFFGMQYTRSFTIVTAIDLDSDFAVQIMGQIPKVLLIVLLPILLISFFLSVLISKRTLKPVIEVTAAAQKITSSKLDSRLPLSGNDDEIDELTKTFNRLIEQLQKDFERERQFSSDVSHELKTPLAVILGQTNLLMRWGKDNPEQLEKSLLAIKKESKSMETVIENLLQISRYESGRLKPSFGKVHVNELFTRLQNEFSELEQGHVEQDRGVEIKIECPDELVILSDEELLHQIFTIFISNSIKFALPENPCVITLRALSKDDEAAGLAEHFILEEEDNGPGIAEEALPHIFDRFYRGDDSHCRNVGGSGLGLSIAKTLAAALEFKRSAFSDGQERKGATFRLEL